MKSSDMEIVAKAASRGARADSFVGLMFYALSALFCLVTGAAYIPPIGTLPDQLEVIDSIMPIQVWAWGWVALSVLLIVAIFSHRVQRVAIPLFAAMLATLAASYLVENLSEDVSRAWVSVKNYAYMWLSMITSMYFIARLVIPDRLGDADES